MTQDRIPKCSRVEAMACELALELERVKERVQHLEAANQELESFSFSACHDLRAPLRALSIYAEILTQEHAAGLNVEGRTLLDGVLREARRMSQLTEDLLAFSRNGYRPKQLTEFDMAELVGEVLAEQQALHPERKVVFKLEPLPPTQADRAMIRQIWANLLSNAIKYTRTRAEAVIEVGSRSEHGITVYYVRDNGVGFDMTQAHRLFSPFQRLHDRAAFDGNGIGLALIDRIVRRHGGRAWAEGRINEGAVFYFTLHPEKRRNCHVDGSD